MSNPLYPQQCGDFYEKQFDRRTFQEQVEILKKGDREWIGVDENGFYVLNLASKVVQLLKGLFGFTDHSNVYRINSELLKFLSYSHSKGYTHEVDMQSLKTGLLLNKQICHEAIIAIDQICSKEADLVKIREIALGYHANRRSELRPHFWHRVFSSATISQDQLHYFGDSYLELAAHAAEKRSDGSRDLNRAYYYLEQARNLSNFDAKFVKKLGDRIVKVLAIACDESLHYNKIQLQKSLKLLVEKYLQQHPSQFHEIKALLQEGLRFFDEKNPNNSCEEFEIFCLSMGLKHGDLSFVKPYLSGFQKKYCENLPVLEMFVELYRHNNMNDSVKKLYQATCQQFMTINHLSPSAKKIAEMHYLLATEFPSYDKETIDHLKAAHKLDPHNEKYKRKLYEDLLAIGLRSFESVRSNYYLQAYHLYPKEYAPYLVQLFDLLLRQSSDDKIIPFFYSLKDHDFIDQVLDGYSSSEESDLAWHLHTRGFSKERNLLKQDLQLQLTSPSSIKNGKEAFSALKKRLNIALQLFDDFNIQNPNFEKRCLAIYLENKNSLKQEDRSILNAYLPLWKQNHRQETTTLSQIAEVYWISDQKKEALEIYTEICKSTTDPHSSFTSDLAKMHYRLGKSLSPDKSYVAKPQEVLERLQKAYELNPNESSYRLALYAALVDVGNYEGSKDRFLTFEKYDIKKQIECYASAYKLHPKKFAPYINTLIKLYLKQEETIQLADLYLQLKKNALDDQLQLDAQEEYKLGLALESKGMLDDALGLFEKAFSKKGQLEVAERYLAVLMKIFAAQAQKAGSDISALEEPCMNTLKRINQLPSTSLKKLKKSSELMLALIPYYEKCMDYYIEKSDFAASKKLYLGILEKLQKSLKELAPTFFAKIYFQLSLHYRRDKESRELILNCFKEAIQLDPENPYYHREITSYDDPERADSHVKNCINCFKNETKCPSATLEEKYSNWYTIDYEFWCIDRNKFTTRQLTGKEPTLEKTMQEIEQAIQK